MVSAWLSTKSAAGRKKALVWEPKRAVEGWSTAEKERRCLGPRGAAGVPVQHRRVLSPSSSTADSHSETLTRGTVRHPKTEGPLGSPAAGPPLSRSAFPPICLVLLPNRVMTSPKWQRLPR